MSASGTWRNMDGIGLFRKLTAGTKIDYKRFQGDAEKLKIRKEAANPVAEAVKNPLDFFGDDTGHQRTSVKRKVQSSDISSKTTKDQKQGSDSEDDDEDTKDVEDSSDDEDEGEKDEDEASEEEEEELKLLGSITSKGRDRTRDRRKKKKKCSPALLAELKQEKMNCIRRANHIHVHGTDVPDPIVAFEEAEFNLHPSILANLKAIGFTEPTPIQIQAIPVMMQRRELLACAPTGSGKTAAFVIPILHQLKEPRRKGFRALVLAPTRELAKQIYRVFCQLADGTGFRIHFIEKASTAAKKFGPKSSQKFDILVTTPNRLVFMLQQQPPAISLSNVEWLVVDESDKLFEEGKRGFRDQLATIYKSCDGQNVRHAMFSATFAFDVEQWCKLNLDNIIQVYIGARNAATETVTQELTFVGSEYGKLVAMRNMVQKGLTPPVLVFVQSKDRAKELFHELIYEGINVEVIHADRTQHQRDNIVKGFRSGKIWVLICTELMGRGIDFKGVALVINYDFPTSAVSYIHRIGRTGRAGHPGKAITFFTEADSVNLKSIANVMRSSGCRVPDYMLKMKQASRRVRRDLEKNVPKRETIRTFPQDDIKKAHSRRIKIKRLQKGPQLVGSKSAKADKKGMEKRNTTDSRSSTIVNKNRKGKNATKKQKQQTET